jgi:DNA polymerase-1
LTEEDALLNARLARILTDEDYDSKQKQPKLWTPEASYTIDDGTGLQDASY